MSKLFKAKAEAVFPMESAEYLAGKYGWEPTTETTTYVDGEVPSIDEEGNEIMVPGEVPQVTVVENDIQEFLNGVIKEILIEAIGKHSIQDIKDGIVQKMAEEIETYKTSLSQAITIETNVE